MALNSSQISNYLFKVLQGKSSTNDGRQFFEEPYNNREVVFPNQIWGEVAKIPTTAPGGADAVTTGVVQRFINKVLTAVPGTTNAFFHADLVDTIPFNFGDGSYNYALSDNVGGSIPFGAGDWVVDTANGVVTFYGTVPGNMPPRISYYKYVGKKGAGAGSFIDDTSTNVTFGAGPVALTGLIFPVADVRTAFVEYQAYKTENVTTYQESGKFTVVNSSTAARDLSFESSVRLGGRDPNILFTIELTTGQVFCENLSAEGLGGVGVLKVTYRAKVFAP